MTRTKSRMLKIQCSGCGAILYGSKQSIRKASKLQPWHYDDPGGLQCVCGGYLTPAHVEDRELIEGKPGRKPQFTDDELAALDAQGLIKRP